MTFLESADPGDFGITQKLTVNARALGPRLGKQVQQVIQAAKAGRWVQSGVSTGSTTGTVEVDGIELYEGEFDLELEAADESSAIAFLGDGGFVLIDTELTPELLAEGFARDIIRAIQDTRKAAGLEVSDRIVLTITGAHKADIGVLGLFVETIAAETLAVEATFTESADPESTAALDGAAGTQRTVLAVGQYSNAGVLVIDVTKSGAVDV